MFENLFLVFNRKQAQGASEHYEAQDQELWQAPPAQMEELPIGLIEDQI